MASPFALVSSIGGKGYMAKDKGKDVVGFGDMSPEEMSFQDFLDAGVIDIAQVDDTVAVKQAELVGVPFILYEWEVKESQTYGGEYAICRVKTAEGTRVFADGGAGIAHDLERYKSRLVKGGEDPFSPLYFHFGLRESTYTTEVEGKPTQATTYYFDNRPRP